MAPEKRGRLLIVDDEVELMNALCETLSEQGFDTVGAVTPSEGLKALSEGEFDLLLSDLMMPEMDGIRLLKLALEAQPGLVGIIMTGQGTIPTAIDAMKTGAFDYVLKPFTLQTMLPLLDRAMEVRHLRAENRRLRDYVEHLGYESPRYQLVGASPAMRQVRRLIERVAPTDSTVLIRGESGTGKELVARALHRNSKRASHPLVTINCATLQDSLLESELFGHEKGSFTGAIQSKRGLVEVAEGGTLFIDEVAEMSVALQAKLLRVLEDGHYRRVGSVKESQANVRVIAATNKPLEQEQKAGRFREDLFYRLSVFSIDLPPLRERLEDLPELVEHLLTTRKVNGSHRVSPEVLQTLSLYPWPGNVRELVNVLERAQILAEGDLLTLDDLPGSLHPASSPHDPAPADSLELEVLERRAVLTALERADGNKVQAAKLLGVSRRSLYRLIEKYGLEHLSSKAEPKHE